MNIFGGAALSPRDDTTPRNCVAGQFYNFNSSNATPYHLGDVVPLQWGAYNAWTPLNISLTRIGGEIVEDILEGGVFAMGDDIYPLSHPSSNCTLESFNWTIPSDFNATDPLFSFAMFNATQERGTNGNSYFGFINWSPRFYITDTSTATSTSSPTSATPTSTTTISSSSSSSTSSSTSYSVVSGPSTGAIAGISVGVALGVIILLGLAAFFFLRRRRARAAGSQRAAAEMGSNEKEKARGLYEAVPHSQSSAGEPQELGGDEPISYELASDTTARHDL